MMSIVRISLQPDMDLSLVLGSKQVGFNVPPGKAFPASMILP
jgi:hypothetical protein